MKRSIEVLFSPAEYAALRGQDLSDTTCVVFDILRATSTMMTALANGAKAIIPVAEIPEALAVRQRQPEVLLAGERDGLRIRSALTGSVDFDLGNSPREFTSEVVREKIIAMSTTNGTRALRACAGAEAILIGSFLNLKALVAELQRRKPSRLLLVCAGTQDQTSLEDTLAAGAVADAVLPDFQDAAVSDAVMVAAELYRRHADDLPGAMQLARNGKRLLALPELAADVPLCLQKDTLGFVAALGGDGRVMRIA